MTLFSSDSEANTPFTRGSAFRANRSRSSNRPILRSRGTSEKERGTG